MAQPVESMYCNLYVGASLLLPDTQSFILEESAGQQQRIGTDETRRGYSLALYAFGMYAAWLRKAHAGAESGEI